MNTEPIVLAFSGGLDTSWAIPYLAETTGRPVATVTVDTGGFDTAAREELAARAAALGASDHRMLDARGGVLRARAALPGRRQRSPGRYLSALASAPSAASRPRRRSSRASSGAPPWRHGSTAAGNDQVRFEVALRTLRAGLRDPRAGARLSGLARRRRSPFSSSARLPVPAHGAAYSVNRGLWGTTIGGSETKSSTAPLPESAWVATRGAFDSPRTPERRHARFRARRAGRLRRRALSIRSR